MLTMDQYIADTIYYSKYYELNYVEFLFPELKPFLYEETINEISAKLPDKFDVKRRIGENDNYVCQLIKNDLIHEFISYATKVNLSLKGPINPSIFETNSFLLKNKSTTLIQYAAFYGSVHIFKYLQMSGVEINFSLWQYAIHGACSEIIYLLQESKIVMSMDLYIKLIVESIKCHNDSITEFIKAMIEEDENEKTSILNASLKYYNFAYIQNDDINEKSFDYLCIYDYSALVNILLNTPDLKIEFTTEIRYIFQ